jgi:hypothetical protein
VPVLLACRYLLCSKSVTGSRLYLRVATLQLALCGFLRWHWQTETTRTRYNRKPSAIRHVVGHYAREAGIDKLAPHDLRCSEHYQRPELSA